MKIISVKSLAIPDIKVIRFARFIDHRGYFTEQFRKSDLLNRPDLPTLQGAEFVQANQSYSKKGVVRGLHFQWNPLMGKLVRTLSGRMVDLVLDIRVGSPTLGKIIAFDMPQVQDNDFDTWIWVPPGFAHGNYYTQDSLIEYSCTGEYSPNCEGGISPLSPDLDWSLCDPNLKAEFDEVVNSTELMSDKDRDAQYLQTWLGCSDAENFNYGDLRPRTNHYQVLVTGGSGLLGTELKQQLPEAMYPSEEEFNVTDYEQMSNYLVDKNISQILHAAAFTSPPEIDKNPQLALDTNIVGTANLVRLCIEKGIKLTYMCTDYVFKGNQGNYKETDPVHPVNKYAWSKLGGECAVRMYDNSLIIRTSFGSNEFPYEKAFTDQWTSRESVKAITQKIVKVIDTGITGVIHIGGPRRSAYEYAKSLDQTREIGELSLSDVSFVAPVDTSLDSKKYNSLVGNQS